MMAAGAPPISAGSIDDLEDLDELRLRASLLSFFEIPWLGLTPSSAAVDTLLRDCDRVQGPDGRRHWSMSDSARREALLHAGLQRAQAAWLALDFRPDDDEQKVIDLYFGDESLETLESVPADRARAMGIVFRWLGVLGGQA